MFLSLSFLCMFLSLLDIILYFFILLSPISEAFFRNCRKFCHSTALSTAGTCHAGRYLEVLNPYVEAMLSENRENNCTFLFVSCKLFLFQCKAISAS